MVKCTEKDYRGNLHDFLNELSPDCPVELFDNDDGNKLFDGYAGEITETTRFYLYKVDTHCFINGKMMIWIF